VRRNPQHQFASPGTALVAGVVADIGALDLSGTKTSGLVPDMQIQLSGLKVLTVGDFVL
jgi:hypothetical protein